MINKRLFTFGCSFTNYYWPTWSDLVGSRFQRYQNWGKSGGGNFYISSQLYECHQLNNITKDDVVMVMFTGTLRYDYIGMDSKYHTYGNILNSKHIDELYKFWSPEFGYYMSWFSIQSVINLLNNIGCEYKIMTAFNLKYDLKESSNRYGNCFNGIEHLLPHVNLMDYNDSKNIKGYSFSDTGTDYHPTIDVHLSWVKDYIGEYYHPDMDELCEKWKPLVYGDRNEMRERFVMYRGESIIDFENNKCKKLI